MVRCCNCPFICSTKSWGIPSYSPFPPLKALCSWKGCIHTARRERVSSLWKDQASPVSCVSWFMQELCVSLYLVPCKALWSPIKFLDIIHLSRGNINWIIFPPVTWEGPAHYGTCHPWACGPKLYKKTSSMSHRDQASQQYFSLAWASAPVCMSPPCTLLELLTSLGEGLLPEIGPFFLKLHLVLVFCQSKRNPKMPSKHSRGSYSVSEWREVEL